MKILSQFELGFHVAAIDGEGHIGLYRQNINRREYYYTANINVENTKREFLEYLFNTTHIGEIGPETENGEKHKNRWRWYLRKHEMKPYLLLIKDHLIIKKEQAELMLEYLKLPCNKNHYIPVPEEVIIQRMAIYDEMKFLNKRGK